MILHLLKLHVILILAVFPLLTFSEESPPVAKPDCEDHCGKVKIPYPFGIGADCYAHASYEITCDNSSDPPKPYLSRYGLELMDIGWGGKYSLEDPEFQLQGSRDQLLTVLAPARNICTSGASVDLRGSPFRFSVSLNVLMAEGCGGSIMLRNRSGTILSGCASVCAENNVSSSSGQCYGGNGCCQAPLFSYPLLSIEESDSDNDLDFYQLSLDHEAVSNFHACNMTAALINRDSIANLSGKLSGLGTFPVVLQWIWGGMEFPAYKQDFQNVSCVSDLDYYHSLTEGDGLWGRGGCICNYLYEGNPYLPNGCQFLRSCRRCRHHPSRCISVQKVSHTHYYCQNPLLRLGSILGFSLGMGFVLLLLGCYWLYRVIKRKREVKRKADYFRRNGGLLLKQQISSGEGFLENTKIFRVTELQRATDNFNKNRILGQGGQGTVYKGMLTDGSLVAIKKSKQVDESQLEQFINEVVLLSQINHRNVVKLIGCCLETEVPFVVYEFVPNGALYQHINDPSEDFQVTWKMRLQIAAESADALSYLHSSSSNPIYHRDIKSSNILLDEKYRAKVADFGTSRAITIEQTHVTTCVLGTYGYLDPEYFRSNQFTEKSDVYSFGVVLVELLTGKKPICPTKDGGWISLASEFLSHMEASRLFDIVDGRVLEEGTEEEFVAVANLARRCLNMNGKLRPTMKEITVVLDGIRSPKGPKLREQNHMHNTLAIFEACRECSAPFTADTIFSDYSPGSPSTAEIKPLMANTI